MPQGRAQSVDGGNRVGLVLDGIFKSLARAGPVAQLHQGISQILLGLGEAAFRGDSLAKVLDRSRKLALLQLKVTQSPKGISILMVKAQHGFGLLLRALKVAAAEEHRRELEPRTDAFGIVLDFLLEIADGVLQSATIDRNQGFLQPRPWEPRIERQRSIDSHPGPLLVIAGAKRDGEMEVTFRRISLLPDFFPRCGHRANDLTGRNRAQVNVTGGTHILGCLSLS